MLVVTWCVVSMVVPVYDTPLYDETVYLIGLQKGHSQVPVQQRASRQLQQRGREGGRERTNFRC